MSVREGYKQTEIGVIPEEWEVVKLGELVSTLTDYTANGSFASLKQNVKYYNEPNYAALVRTTDLKKKEFLPERFTDKQGYEYLTKSALFGGEILMANVGSIGEVYIVPTYDKPMTLAPNMYLIKYSERLMNLYAFYFMNSRIFQKQLLSKIASTTLQAVNKSNFKSIKIPLPPPSEQQKIATILTSVDNKIEVIDEQIAKTEVLKKGLMQKLLSEGIGHTEFKESEIGRIPKEWEVVRLGDIVYDMKSGLSRKLSLDDIGLPVLRSNNISDTGKIDISDIKYWYIDDPQGADTSKYFLKKGDILVNFINSMAQIGKSAVYQGELQRNTIFTTNILKLSTSANTQYLYNVMQTSRYWSFIQSITKPAVNQASFTTKEFKLFKLALPPIEEQKQIATILSSSDEKLDTLRKKKSRYETLKKGLMQKLLMGEIRVGCVSQRTN